jgi:hypothetical protein
LILSMILHLCVNTRVWEVYTQMDVSMVMKSGPLVGLSIFGEGVAVRSWPDRFRRLFHFLFSSSDKLFRSNRCQSRREYFNAFMGQTKSCTWLCSQKLKRKATVPASNIHQSDDGMDRHRLGWNSVCRKMFTNETTNCVS